MRTSIEGESDSTVTPEEFKCRSVSITFLYDTFIEADGEACAAFRAVRRAKRSILRRQNHAGESKTDTDTLGGRSLSFIETLEEVRKILRREAGAAVFRQDFRIDRSFGGGDPDGSSDWRVLHAVLQDISQRFAAPFRIAGEAFVLALNNQLLLL